VVPVVGKNGKVENRHYLAIFFSDGAISDKISGPYDLIVLIIILGWSDIEFVGQDQHFQT
jgi:hypothetical protein